MTSTQLTTPLPVRLAMILTTKGHLDSPSLISELNVMYRVAFKFSAYNSFSVTSGDLGCTTETAKITLSTQFIVPLPAILARQPEGLTVAEDSFFSHIGSTSCHYSYNPVRQRDPTINFLPASTPAPSFPQSTVPSPRIATQSSLVPSPRFATQSSSLSSRSSSPSHTQSPSANTGETSKLVIGLVVALVVVILLVIIGLVYYSVMRKRRRMKDEVAKAHQDNVNEADSQGGNPQLYFQHKVELDDEQRRHEMEAVELRHELQGLDEIHEMPADEGDRHCGRRELKG